MARLWNRKRHEEVVFDLSAVKRYHYELRGRVQGVGFRYTATGIARSLGLTGWVRNEYDGSVTMELQGLPERINEFFGELVSDPYIRIRDIHQEEQEPVQERGFGVHY